MNPSFAFTSVLYAGAMETRLLFAYSLVALLLIGCTVLLAMVMRNRRTAAPADLERPARAQPARRPGMPRRQRLQTLEVGRGLAALAVVLFHINELFRHGRFGTPANLFTPFAGGYAGVQFFFVLSGFLMAHLHGREIGKRGKASAFIAKRLRRIYPLYWSVTLALLPLFFLMPDVGEGNETNPVQIAASLLLFPRQQWPIVGVAWTLRFEMLFYLVFALTIYRPKWGFGVGAVLATGAIVAHFHGFAYPLAFFFSPYVLLFGYGVIAARTWPLIGRHAVPVAAGGLLLFVYFELAAAYRSLSDDLIRNGLGIAAAVAIAGLVAHEQQGRSFTPKPLVRLGAASYALYLVHYHALAIGARILQRLGLSGLPDPIIALVLVSIALCAGFGAHYLVERPLDRLLRRKRVPSAPIAEPPEPNAAHPRV
jgi:exopolysaccharide production protein ExoZ